jgi:hypothetical protein
MDLKVFQPIRKLLISITGLLSLLDVQGGRSDLISAGVKFLEKK